MVAEAERGRVRASAAILGAGGVARCGSGRCAARLTVTSSHMVITEPVPDLIEELGWTGGECITDSRSMVHYFRTTPDGRIAFGWGGGRIVFAARTCTAVPRSTPALAAEVEAPHAPLLPAARGPRGSTHAWGGPIDVSPTHLPVISRARARRSTSRLRLHRPRGRALAHARPLARLDGARPPATSSAARDRRPAAGERAARSPSASPAASIIRRAILRKEAALEGGRRPGPMTRVVAGIPERIGIHIGR